MILTVPWWPLFLRSIIKLRAVSFSISIACTFFDRDIRKRKTGTNQGKLSTCIIKYTAYTKYTEGLTDERKHIRFVSFCSSLNEEVGSISQLIILPTLNVNHSSKSCCYNGLHGKRAKDSVKNTQTDVVLVQASYGLRMGNIW